MTARAATGCGSVRASRRARRPSTVDELVVAFAFANIRASASVERLLRAVVGTEDECEARAAFRAACDERRRAFDGLVARAAAFEGFVASEQGREVRGQCRRCQTVRRLAAWDPDGSAICEGCAVGIVA